MVDIQEVLEAEEPSGPEQLEPVRLGEEPSLLMLFTSDGERARLHFEPDSAVNGYLPCPGEGCPLCFLGQSPKDFALLPVLNLEKRAVEVLRISTRRGPGTLAAGLLPHLRDEAIENEVFSISRVGAKFRVEVRPLGERADRCTGVIEAFLRARGEGLSLLSAFAEYTAAELAEIERVRLKLDAVGGWTPPSGAGDVPR